MITKISFNRGDYGAVWDRGLVGHRPFWRVPIVFSVKHIVYSILWVELSTIGIKRSFHELFYVFFFFYSYFEIY